ncbi:RNA polymerase-associated protein RapA [Aurantivibrio plasticivorans]
MSDHAFKLGQRWISNTEPELGLGIVTDNENRRVTIQFPAVGERRTYANDNAPLTRVQYQVGDEISNTQRESMTISDIEEEQGYIVYAGVDADGQPAIIPELELNSFVQFRRPQDRLFAGQIDKLNKYTLRYQTLMQQHALNSNSNDDTQGANATDVKGILGARVQLLPHQLHIAHEVAHRYAPRVLLADEVGLGKTIEAGLIAHHQLQTGRAERVLVVVPPSLVHQWLVEMLRRFNLAFTVLDETRCEALETNDDNPFETTQLAICSIDFLANNSERHQQAVDATWDLLIVDEAHHLEWSDDLQQPAAQNYRCVEALAKVCDGLLLITATPEQLGELSHFARLRLLDPDRYFDFEKYQQEELGYRPANELVQHLTKDNARQDFFNDKDQVKQLHSLVGKELSQTLEASIADDSSWTKAVTDCTQFLLDHHGTGRVLFRNTRNAVEGFPKRALNPHPIQPPAELKSDSTDVTSLLQPEILLGKNWLETDTRIPWLVHWLKQHRSEKVLLICHSLETTLELEDYLRLRKGIRATAFHEELSLIERDRAAAYFADEIDGAQLLVCSEIGSEGRNFQFSHHLVLFDLPFNPDLLEQRIGRLARIGQKHTVQIHVPFYQQPETGPIEKLLQWYHQGLNAIEKPCAPAQMIFQQFQERLSRTLLNDKQENWEDLLRETKITTDEILSELAAGRDRLLEMNSCNTESAQRIIDTIESIDASEDLAAYLSLVFDEFGVEEDHHSENAIVLHPTEHMHNQSFPGLTDEGLTATYNRNLALSREDMEFLTWEHPMVQGAMDMILGGELGNTALGTIKLPPLKAGTLLLEAVYSVHCPAPKSLQLDRYFVDHSLRLLLNNTSDLSKVISFEQLNKIHQPAPNKKTAQNIVKHAKADLQELLLRCQQTADKKKTKLISSATEQLARSQGNELLRLKTLAEINPNIRQQEISQLEAVIDEQHALIQQTQYSLEMLRVIVCT